MGAHVTGGGGSARPVPRFLRVAHPTAAEWAIAGGRSSGSKLQRCSPLAGSRAMTRLKGVQYTGIPAAGGSRMGVLWVDVFSISSPYAAMSPLRIPRRPPGRRHCRGRSGSPVNSGGRPGRRRSASQPGSVNAGLRLTCNARSRSRFILPRGAGTCLVFQRGDAQQGGHATLRLPGGEVGVGGVPRHPPRISRYRG